MATSTVGKSPPNKNDAKNASLAMKSRQQVISEVNKRRTLLQDNSWIKKRPEEENADENYGRAVLNQYKSQEGLHRNTEENGDQKALISRYRSDTTLDRISGGSDADKANKLPTFDGRSNKSKEPDVILSPDNPTSPVKKKRQSWMPPTVSNQKTTKEDVEPKRQSWTKSNTASGIAVNNKPVSPSSEKTGGPKMTIYSSEPIASQKEPKEPIASPKEPVASPKELVSPKPNVVANNRPTTRQISPLKSNETDANRPPTTDRAGRNQDLENLIKVKAKEIKTNQKNQGLDNFTQDKAKIKKQDQRRQELDDVTQVNHASNGHSKGERNLDDSITEENAEEKDRRSQELDDHLIIKSPGVDQNKKWTSEKDYKVFNIPSKQSDTENLYQVTKGSSYNGSSNHSHPKNTTVYTRTYENSRFPHDVNQDRISGKSIKTVYSTSDRAIIEKEMCTYCRKPLGLDTKMILDALQICCHASCFKCEACEKPLENLKAGDSIWIYKNTVHCTPCYSKVKASWAY
ncbi:sciellin isoform X1 [Anolis carolinensis]|uniref:sciellin isoform X1 n=1 Tax=Anolis carolinensis TaxID=28377 RepID=UPI002F2B495C